MDNFRIGKFLVEIVDSPLETLSESQKDVYGTESVPVARDGFGNPNITEEDIKMHVLDSSTTIFVRDASNEIIGFSSSTVENIADEQIIYLQGTAISKKAQGQGVYNIFNPLRILAEADKLGDDVLVGTRTQSPLVYKVMSRKLGLFPRVGEETPLRIQSIAHEFAQHLYDDHSDFRTRDGLVFDAEVGIVRKAYGLIVDGEEKGLNMYGDNIPFCRDDEELNDFMKANLNYNQGDAIIIMGFFDRAKTRIMLEEAVTKMVFGKRFR